MRFMTAKYALEQGRDVFVVPGNVDDEGFRRAAIGCCGPGPLLWQPAQEIMEEYERNLSGQAFADPGKNPGRTGTRENGHSKKIKEKKPLTTGIPRRIVNKMTPLRAFPRRSGG